MMRVRGLVSVRIALLSCRRAGNPRAFAPIREPVSGMAPWRERKHRRQSTLQGCNDSPTGGMGMIYPIMKLAAISLAGTTFAASAALAQTKLPPTVTMTAYDTGTSGFNITVAIGKMIKDKYGSDTRVLPAGNDVARLQPLRAHRATLSALGVGGVFAPEGLVGFGPKEWGPQPVQN